ncbi:MAG: hypothetical protein J5824_10935, partial [Lachnospiraceae bacterium]|nr:hypothetical protein [Lachnospiraceae bacterium]
MELRAGTREMIENLREFYQKNMYGIWREGENVTYELLGEDPKSKENDGKPRNPFEIVGGDLVKIKAEMNGRRGEFVVHVYVPEKDVKVCGTQKNAGSPFIICMHPIMPKDLALSQGYAVIVMESIKVASDDTKHIGAFYDLYPYGEDGEDQTGVLMAWAWGASKVLDAVYNGLDKEYDLDADASMVTGVSRWGKSTAVCGAFDRRFRMTIPACSGAGGLAQYNVFSEGKTYDLTGVGSPSKFTNVQESKVNLYGASVDAKDINYSDVTNVDGGYIHGISDSVVRRVYVPNTAGTPEFRLANSSFIMGIG